MRLLLIEQYVGDGCYPEGLSGEPVPMLFNKLAYPSDICQLVSDEVLIFGKDEYKQFLEQKETEDIHYLIDELGVFYLESSILPLSEIKEDDIIFFMHDDIISDICNDESITKEELFTDEYLIDGNTYEWINFNAEIEVCPDYFSLDRWDGSNKIFHSVGRHARVYCVKTVDCRPVEGLYLVKLWSQWENERINYGCVMCVNTLYEYFRLNFKNYNDEWDNFLEYEQEVKESCC